MSKVYYTSDWHLGHEFVARLRGFDNTADHDAAVIDALRSTVTKRDILINLGDLAIANFDYPISVARDLPCTVDLVAGNHDPVHPLHRNAHRKQRAFLAGFDSVQPYMRRKIAGRQVLINHLPYGGDHTQYEDRHTQYRMPDEGLPLICGHVHEAWRTHGHQLNVGVDQWDLTPVPEEAIADWLATLPDREVAHA